MLESIQVNIKDKGDSRILSAFKDKLPFGLNEMMWKYLVLDGTICLVTHIKNDEAVFVEGRKLQSKQCSTGTESESAISTAYISGYVRPYVIIRRHGILCHIQVKICLQTCFPC